VASPSTVNIGGALFLDIHIKTAHLAHGLMLVVAWGLLLPTGAFLSATWRHRLCNGAWLRLHRAMQMLGVLLTFGGVLAGVLMTPFHFTDPHHVGGVIVVVFTIIHPIISMTRGKPTAATGGVRTTWRVCWELMHKGGGYLLIVAGGFQCYSGYLLMRDGLWLWLLYLGFLAVALGVLAAGVLLRRARPRVVEPTPAVNPQSPSQTEVQQLQHNKLQHYERQAQPQAADARTAAPARTLQDV